jgi:hypothetical protein
MSSDRFRTAINVFGDSIGCAIVQHLSSKELRALENVDRTVTSVLPLLSSNIETNGNQTITNNNRNPAFIDEFDATNNDEHDNTARTHF